MKGLSKYDLANSANIPRGMLSSYEIDDIYTNLDFLNKLGTVLDISILCKDGYSRFLLESDKFKDKLTKWRKENALTKRAAAKLLKIFEIGYGLCEEGSIMSSTTYAKVENNLIVYNLTN